MKTNQLQKNIPNGWQLTKLADIGAFSKGAGISKEELSESGHNAIRYGELYTRHHVKVDKIYSFISDKVIPLTKKIKYGDILFAGSGETIDEIGKSATYLLKEVCYAGGDVIIFRPKNANSLFLSYFLNFGEGRKKLRELGQGQSVVHIYKSDIETLKLHLPLIPEQNRIVSVLETWDKAIENLNKKIEIKKQIKKCLMQDLLTGKKRLSGFKDKWETILFDECISNIGDGGTPDRKNDSYFGGSIPWVVIGDIEPQIYKTSETLTDLGLKKSSSKLWKKGSIILSTGATIGNVGIAMVDVCTKQGITGIEIKNTFSNFYIYNWLLTQKNKLISIGHGGTFKDIRPSSIKKLKITISKSKEEQDAIAEILTSADKEITELEKKLSIIKDQKKYLLNNLITGAIRTPENLKVN